MPKFFCLLAALYGLILAGPVAAEQTTLQVDLLLVQQPSWVRSRDNGEWPLQKVEPVDALSPADLSMDPAFGWQPGDNSAFAAQAAKLESQGYKTLYLASFSFPQTRLRNATTWEVSEGEPLTIAAEDPYAPQNGVDPAWFDRPADTTPETLTPISGWIRSWVDTYLFVEFDIARIIGDSSLRNLVAEQSPGWQNTPTANNGFAQAQFGTPQNTPTQPGWSTADIWPREAITMHRIHARKRVKLNEIHYFDHPQVGILIRVTEPRRNAPAESTP